MVSRNIGITIIIFYYIILFQKYYKLINLSLLDNSKNGTIELSPYGNNMDVTWILQSKCANVKIWSEFFETEENFDFLWIEDNEYTGNQKINQTMPNNSTVRFMSDKYTIAKGFKLIWNCEEKSN